MFFHMVHPHTSVDLTFCCSNDDWHRVGSDHIIDKPYDNQTELRMVAWTCFHRQLEDSTKGKIYVSYSFV